MESWIILAACAAFLYFLFLLHKKHVFETGESISPALVMIIFFGGITAILVFTAYATAP